MTQSPKPFLTRLAPYAALFTLLASPIRIQANPPIPSSCDKELSLDDLRTIIIAAESLTPSDITSDHKLSPAEYTTWLNNNYPHSWHPCGYPLQPDDETFPDVPAFFTDYDRTHDGYVSAADDLNHDGIINCDDLPLEPRTLGLTDPDDCAILTHTGQPLLLQYGTTAPYVNYTQTILSRLQQQSLPVIFYRIDTNRPDTFSRFEQCVKTPHIPASEFPYVLLINYGKVLAIINPLTTDDLESKILERIQDPTPYSIH